MMFTILSPAKKLDFSRPIPSVETTQPALMNDSTILMSIVRNLSLDQIAQLMGVSEKLAGLTYARFEAFELPFSNDNAQAAALAFDGEAYRGFDAGSLSIQALEWAQGHLGILSGLFGLLRPLDLIQPYRLEIATTLKTARGSNLYQFWGERITARINDILATAETPVLLNLASGEYFKAVKKKALKARVITPVFHEVKEGQPGKVISFSAKFARGLMVRYIVEHRIDDPETLKEFNLERYAFHPGLSDDDTWIFSREFVSTR